MKDTVSDSNCPTLYLATLKGRALTTEPPRWLVALGDNECHRPFFTSNQSFVKNVESHDGTFVVYMNFTSLHCSC